MPAPHPFVDVVQHGFEDRVVDSFPQDFERLDQRHARLQQRRELLVEHEELAGRYPAPAREAEVGQAEGSRALNGEDIQPFLLELPAKPRFVVGDVNAFDDVAARGAEPAAKLHHIFE